MAGALLAPAAGLSVGAAAAAASRPVLHCAWALQPGPQPVKLRFTLHNRGAEAVHLLVWGTPFEGWMSPWATLLHEGRPLPYGGPTVKRGDPGADEYLTLAPGQARRRAVDLAEVFDLSRPGTYEVRPAITLHDAYTGARRPPRPRAQHEALALDCPVLRFTRLG